jgi:hypothetical protein
MAYSLHLVMGEIGGVGKSWFTKMLIETYISLKLDYFVVDCDETTPNVGRAYDRENYDPEYIREYQSKIAKINEELKPLLQAASNAEQFSLDAPELLEKAKTEHEKEQSKESGEAVAKINNAEAAYKAAVAAYDKAKIERTPNPLRKPIYFITESMSDRDIPSEMIGMAMEKDTIVNLPAQVTKVVNSWIQESGLLGMKEDGLETICWFVAKPTKASIEQLKLLHAAHTGKLKIVLVKNNFVGHAGSWSEAIDPITLNFLKKAKIEQIDLTDLRLNEEQRNLIDRDYATFSELVSDTDDRLKFHEKRKITQYMTKTIETIIGTELLPKVKHVV